MKWISLNFEFRTCGQHGKKYSWRRVWRRLPFILVGRRVPIQDAFNTGATRFWYGPPKPKPARSDRGRVRAFLDELRQLAQSKPEAKPAATVLVDGQEAGYMDDSQLADFWASLKTLGMDAEDLANATPAQEAAIKSEMESRQATRRLLAGESIMVGGPISGTAGPFQPAPGFTLAKIKTEAGEETHLVEVFEQSGRRVEITPEMLNRPPGTKPASGNRKARGRICRL